MFDPYSRYLFRRFSMGWGLFCLLALLSSCKSTVHSKNSVSQTDSFYYTCAMHPQIKRDRPGNCPICGMKLIKIRSNHNAQTGLIYLNEVQLKNADIHTRFVSAGSVMKHLPFSGVVKFDEERTFVLSARQAGRIDLLYPRSPGIFVSKGQLLWALYSPQINNAAQEFLISRSRYLTDPTHFTKELMDNAKEKLHVMGLSRNEIATVTQNGHSVLHTYFHSPFSGNVVELNFREGDYVMEGSPVLKISDLSELWVEFKAYPQDFAFLHVGQFLSVSFPGLPGIHARAKVQFINPVLDPETGTILVRAVIANKERLIRPGMISIVLLDQPTSTHFLLPIDAVISSQHGSVVWVKRSPGVYSRRRVVTGVEDGSSIQILRGITGGEEVVTQGAYLLNSEYLNLSGLSE